MLLKIFGSDSQEIIRGVMCFSMVAVLIAIMFIVIWQPAWADRVTSGSVGSDVIGKLSSLLTLFAGYLAGDMKKDSKKE